MLKKSHIYMVTNRYIGVEGGYLGDFSYRTHFEFYPEYCDLEYDTYSMDGTTRDRFIAILEAASPHDQAKILRGVLKRFPATGDSLPEYERKQELAREIEKLAASLESAAVSSPDIQDAGEVVGRALANAQTLIAEHQIADAIDRTHTALHGYVRYLCRMQGVECPKDAKLPDDFSRLRQLSVPNQSGMDPVKILRSMSKMVEELTVARDRLSLSHPGELPDDVDAELCINAGRTILRYLEQRYRKTKESPDTWSW